MKINLGITKQSAVLIQFKEIGASTEWTTDIILPADEATRFAVALSNTAKDAALQKIGQAALAKAIIPGSS